MARPATPPMDRFLQKVDIRGDKECWPWLGASKPGGYGTFRLNTQTFIGAHRFAHESWVGPVLAGNVVMHTCDTPLCVNPRHLSQGTVADNMHDRDRKGRNKSGPNRPSLTGAR